MDGDGGEVVRRMKKEMEDKGLIVEEEGLGAKENVDRSLRFLASLRRMDSYLFFLLLQL